MRILIVNTDYPAFLKQHYRTHSGLAEASFDYQMKVRNASLFGVFDAYSRGFAANGHEAWEVHANNGLLQRQYMVEKKRRPPRQFKLPARIEYQLQLALERTLHRQELRLAVLNTRNA